MSSKSRRKKLARLRAANSAQQAAAAEELRALRQSDLQEAAAKVCHKRTRTLARGAKAVQRAVEQRAAAAEKRVYGRTVTESRNPVATRFEKPKVRG